jgi:hypothetical protein
LLALLAGAQSPACSGRQAALCVGAGAARARRQERACPPNPCADLRARPLGVGVSEPVADEGRDGSAYFGGGDGSEAKRPCVVELLSQLVANVLGGQQTLVAVRPLEAAAAGDVASSPNRPPSTGQMDSLSGIGRASSLDTHAS